MLRVGRRPHLVQAPAAERPPRISTGRPGRGQVPLPVVAPVGSLRVEDCVPLRQALDEAVLRGTDVAVDLSEVESVDSAALAVLLAAHRQLQCRGCALELRHVGPRVGRVLRISGLGQLFTA